MPNAGRVQTLLGYCFFQQEEIQNGKPIGDVEPILVNCLTMNFGLHPDRVEECRDEVKDMLLEFPPQYFKDTGGGMTFLSLCDTKEGEQWTGEHRVMESLVCLGMACGYAEFASPREIWSALPGGMPYIVFDVSNKTKNKKGE